MIDNNYFTIRDILKAHYYIHISRLLIREVENCYETLVYTQVSRCRFSILLQDKLIRIILGAWMTISSNQKAENDNEVYIAIALATFYLPI